MNNSINSKKYLRINFASCKLNKSMVFTYFIVILISWVFIDKLDYVSEYYNNELNIWDGIFTVLSNPFFILYAYIPLTFMSTIPNIKLDRFYKYIAIRYNSKKQLIINSVLVNLIMSFVINGIFFLTIVFINVIYFQVSFNWSSTILNLTVNMPIISSLFSNNFVLELSPIMAFIILYLKFTLTLTIVFMVRDLILDFIENTKLAYTLIIVYLIFNIWTFQFPLKGLVGKILQVLSYNHIILLWYNKFNITTELVGNSFSQITVGQSFIIGVIYLIVIILLRILFAKRLVIHNV